MVHEIQTGDRWTVRRAAKSSEVIGCPFTFWLRKSKKDCREINNNITTDII